MNTLRVRPPSNPTAWLVAGLLATLPLGRPAPAAAQADTGDTSWFVSFSRYGKWAALAGSVSLTTIAILRNRDANEIYDGLVTLCTSAPTDCQRGGDGSYQGTDAERLYQETRRIDRQARAWMLGGQLALAATGVMFLVDLVSDDQGPKNIPFTPLEAFAVPRAVGLRYRF